MLLSKATHHFDLINWWIDSYPNTVFAMGDLLFYGRKNAEARGEHYAYTRYTGTEAAKHDPFALFLDEREDFRGLYLEAEAETGYLRDRNVFGESITIEDTMTVSARYRNGVLLSYCLVAYAPWEGMRVSINSSKGHIELEIIENVTHLLADSERPDEKVSTGQIKQVAMRAFPMFGRPYEIEVPKGEGDHGGGDQVMLDDIFLPDPPDPFHRAASQVDGAASILLGIAANESIRTGQVIQIHDLFAEL